ncbi:MAG: quinolinate synthase NadA [Proteobacteria bacterium]|nr:quinolinate synthase NadA [Pseudomonadota bacterium]
MNAIQEEILELKARMGATILAHNYVDAAVQDIADFCGDSLELSRKAKDNSAETIIFCGVRFMGETAKLLSPGARVLMPAKDAGCLMADMCDPEKIRAYKAGHPDHLLVAYVNTTAETKALVDVCVTSGNAERIVTKLGSERPIMFLPDQNLGANLNNRLGMKMDLWPGCCPVHHRIAPDMIKAAREAHPRAPLMVHLECQPEIVALADAALSTAGMLKFVEKSDAREFIVGTECGMIYRLSCAFPDRKFYGIEPKLVCKNMKKITLENVLDCLKGRGFEIEMDPELMAAAVRPIERMLELS